MLRVVARTIGRLGVVYYHFSDGTQGACHYAWSRDHSEQYEPYLAPTEKYTLSSRQEAFLKGVRWPRKGYEVGGIYMVKTMPMVLRKFNYYPGPRTYRLLFGTPHSGVTGLFSPYIVHPDHLMNEQEIKAFFTLFFQQNRDALLLVRESHPLLLKRIAEMEETPESIKTWIQGAKEKESDYINRRALKHLECWGRISEHRKTLAQSAA
jgi:hypothetical protein